MGQLAFPELLTGLLSGFELSLDLSDIPPGRAHALVRAWSGHDGPVVITDHCFEVQDLGPPADPISSRRREVLDTRRLRLISGLRPPRPGEPPSHDEQPPHDRLNLGVITHSLQLGGAELWLAELLRRSAAGRAFSCRVLSPWRSSCRSLEGTPRSP